VVISVKVAEKKGGPDIVMYKYYIISVFSRLKEVTMDEVYQHKAEDEIPV